ncbi:LCP family protein [Streptomyces vinaceus]|uniref:LCP family protein n=1 Tax=Streptomyces vinaceus TaxID=1960 RepID=UPI00382C96BD
MTGLLAGTGAWMYQKLNANIAAVDITDKLGGNRPAQTGKALNIALIGSDSRSGSGSKYGGQKLKSANSDSLVVLHVSADRSWATAVSIPRDSWVEIPSCTRGDGSASASHPNKINAAFSIGHSRGGGVGGGAACTIKTVENATGLRVDHFVGVGFTGFKDMVNALGGVDICLDKAIRDRKAELNLPAGCQTVKDEDALAFVRARYSLGDGSDIGRIGRQQEFMAAMGAKAKSKLHDVPAMYKFLDAFTKSLTVDKSLGSLKELYELASSMRKIPTDKLTFVTVPNAPRELTVPTDKANVLWKRAEADALFGALSADSPVTDEGKPVGGGTGTASTASAVGVRVLNGTQTQGMAAAAASRVKALGHRVSEVGNASSPATRSTLVYPAGKEKEAASIGDALGVSERTPSSSGTEIVLTLGPDYHRNA